MKTLKAGLLPFSAVRTAPSTTLLPLRLGSFRKEQTQAAHLPRSTLLICHGQRQCWLLEQALSKEVSGKLGPLLHRSQFLPCDSGYRVIYLYPYQLHGLSASIFQCLPQVSVPSATVVSSREFSELTKGVAWTRDFCISKGCKDKTFLGLTA